MDDNESAVRSCTLERPNFAKKLLSNCEIIYALTHICYLPTQKLLYLQLHESNGHRFEYQANYGPHCTEVQNYWLSSSEFYQLDLDGNELMRLKPFLYILKSLNFCSNWNLLNIIWANKLERESTFTIKSSKSLTIN